LSAHNTFFFRHHAPTDLFFGQLGCSCFSASLPHTVKTQFPLFIPTSPVSADWFWFRLVGDRKARLSHRFLLRIMFGVPAQGHSRGTIFLFKFSPFLMQLGCLGGLAFLRTPLIYHLLFFTCPSPCVLPSSLPLALSPPPLPLSTPLYSPSVCPPLFSFRSTPSLPLFPPLCSLPSSPFLRSILLRFFFLSTSPPCFPPPFYPPPLSPPSPPSPSPLPPSPFIRC